MMESRITDLECLHQLIRVLIETVSKHLLIVSDCEMTSLLSELLMCLRQGDEAGWTTDRYLRIGGLSPKFDGLSLNKVPGAYEYYSIISNLTGLIRVESHGVDFCMDSREDILEEIGVLNKMFTEKV